MAKTVSQKPTLLSGGNPQIAKGDGDASVQAYIAAMPGWKSDAGRRLDALIKRTVTDAQKAVRWKAPFYGVEGQGDRTGVGEGKSVEGRVDHGGRSVLKKNNKKQRI